MSDLRLLASVYSEVRLADCLAGLAMTLLEEEAPALALLPVCDECLREGGLDCLTPVFCYGVTLLDEPCADELWVLRVEALKGVESRLPPYSAALMAMVEECVGYVDAGERADG